MARLRNVGVWESKVAGLRALRWQVWLMPTLRWSNLAAFSMYWVPCAVLQRLMVFFILAVCQPAPQPFVWACFLNNCFLLGAKQSKKQSRAKFGVHDSAQVLCSTGSWIPSGQLGTKLQNPHAANSSSTPHPSFQLLETATPAHCQPSGYPHPEIQSTLHPPDRPRLLTRTASCHSTVI